MDIKGLDSDKQEFIRTGCLMMRLAMCYDEIDGSGVYISNYIVGCSSAISELSSYDPGTSKLIYVTKFVLNAVQEKMEETEELIELT